MEANKEYPCVGGPLRSLALSDAGISWRTTEIKMPIHGDVSPYNPKKAYADTMVKYGTYKAMVKNNDIFWLWHDPVDLNLT